MDVHAFASAYEAALRTKDLRVSRVLGSAPASATVGSEILLFGVLEPGETMVSQARLTLRLEPYIEILKNCLLAVASTDVLGKAKEFRVTTRELPQDGAAVVLSLR